MEQFGLFTYERRVKMRKLAICLLVCLLFLPNAWGGGWGHGDKIRVMDWNVYIGTDVFAVVSDLISVDEAVDQIVDSNPVARMKTIAKHIKRLRPKVVFLQEVWLLEIVNVLENSMVEFDFLAELEAELDHYEVAGVHELVDLTLPTSTGYARALDRDVVFLHKSIPFEPAENVRYSNEILLPLPSPPFPMGATVPRGYTKVRATICGNPYLLVNTHVEVFPPFRDWQAQELSAHIGMLSDTVILGGDFNGVSETDAYDAMIGAGFVDSWIDKIFGRWDKFGFTCCQEVDLLNKFSVLDERIDYLFTLNGNFITLSGRVFGDRRFNKTRTFPRLWPSDHGGLIFTLYNYK